MQMHPYPMMTARWRRITFFLSKCLTVLLNPFSGGCDRYWILMKKTTEMASKSRTSCTVVGRGYPRINYPRQPKHTNSSRQRKKKTQNMPVLTSTKLPFDVYVCMYLVTLCLVAFVAGHAIRDG